MYDPDNPGKIIPVMPINPHINMNIKLVFSIGVGLAKEI